MWMAIHKRKLYDAGNMAKNLLTQAEFNNYTHFTILILCNQLHLGLFLKNGGYKVYILYFRFYHGIYFKITIHSTLELTIK